MASTPKLNKMEIASLLILAIMLVAWGVVEIVAHRAVTAAPEYDTSVADSLDAALKEKADTMIIGAKKKERKKANGKMKARSGGRSKGKPSKKQEKQPEPRSHLDERVDR